MSARNHLGELNKGPTKRKKNTIRLCNNSHLVGGLVAIWIIFPYMKGMSSSQLTNSYFSEGWPNHQPAATIPIVRCFKADHDESGSDYVFVRVCWFDRSYMLFAPSELLDINKKSCRHIGEYQGFQMLSSPSSLDGLHIFQSNRSCRLSCLKSTDWLEESSSEWILPWKTEISWQFSRKPTHLLNTIEIPCILKQGVCSKILPDSGFWPWS